MENNPTYEPAVSRPDEPALPPPPMPASRSERVKRYLDDKGITPRVRSAETYLKEHKVLLVCIGFASGYLLGRMLRRS